MKTTILASLSLTLLCATAYADTFGSGLNTFDIDFVTIGNPGNAHDTTGNPNPAGTVDYIYRIGKFEISEDMIDNANALGGLGVTHDGRGPNKPATSISWFEAARFVNWLNGSTPAYKFDGGGNFQLWQVGDAGYDPNNLYRNSLATYFLPSMDEWYKAAYYDPTSGSYFDFPTGSDAVPTAIASSTAVGTAVYDGQLGPADISLAGGLSPYGTMGQGGNAWEWEETDLDLVNDSSSSTRALRGGSWESHVRVESNVLAAWHRSFDSFPSAEVSTVGFRVASVPEPSTLLLGALASMGLTLRRRRSAR
jgi:sulfatase modifying factor 1